MSDAELPPANLILQALHAIKGAIDKTNGNLDELRMEVRSGFAATNARIDQTNARIDETNERLENLRKFTVSNLAELNGKVDRLSVVVEKHGNELHQLNERIDNFLSGEGAKLVKRVDTLELELKRIAAKVDH